MTATVFETLSELQPHPGHSRTSVPKTITVIGFNYFDL